ncbi:TPA: hypothetical protein ACH3X3_007282 [Trebouxia sp. C0006]
MTAGWQQPAATESTYHAIHLQGLVAGHEHDLVVVTKFAQLFGATHSSNSASHDHIPHCLGMPFRCLWQRFDQSILAHCALRNQNLSAPSKGLSTDFLGLKVRGFKPFFRGTTLKYRDAGVVRQCAKGGANKIRTPAPTP